MKTKVIILFVAVVSTINAFSQKQNDKSLYTFCGKSGDCIMTLDEFEKSKKQLTPIDESLKIISFTMVVGVEGSYAEYSSTGSLFSSQANDAIEKFVKAGNKILIEQVQISQSDKIIKVPGMVITLK